MRYVLGFLLSTCALAAHGNTLSQGVEQAGILQGWQDEGGTRIAAIRLRLEPDWKTYWRVPGEGGIPPELDFSASTNIAKVEVVWPAPTAFDQDGLRSIGYTNDVTLPLRITPKDPAQPVELHAQMSMGVCHDICVPATLDMHQTLTGSGEPDPRITTALQQTPRTITAAATCQTQPVSDGVRVTARIPLADAGTSPTLFEIENRPMWTSQTVESRDGNDLLASVDFVPPDAQPFPLDPETLRITVLTPQGAVQIDGCARQNP